MDTPKQRRFKEFAVVDENQARLEPYPYIYVNADGSARELHEGEREHLETCFRPVDGDRPYVKADYSQKNSGGEIKGFLRRSELPRNVAVGPVPAADPDLPIWWNKKRI